MGGGCDAQTSPTALCASMACSVRIEVEEGHALSAMLPVTAHVWKD
jgi:hypothetical protein